MKKYLSDPGNSTQYMFNVFDIDGDGYVTIEEFKKSMRCVGEEQNTKLAGTASAMLTVCL